MTARTFTVTHYARPSTMNYERGTANRWAIAAATKEWRAAFATLARQQHIPQLGPVDIVVEHETRTRRKVDTVACAPSYKAAQDGLRDAGVLVDDTPEFVRSVKFLPPHRTGRDAVSLTLTEVA